MTHPIKKSKTKNLKYFWDSVPFFHFHAAKSFRGEGVQLKSLLQVLKAFLGGKKCLPPVRFQFSSWYCEVYCGCLENCDKETQEETRKDKKGETSVSLMLA